MKIPEQHNHCDCGVYLLQYVEMFLQKMPCEIDDGYVDKKAWFQVDDIALKRTEIKSLLGFLHDDWTKRTEFRSKNKRKSLDIV